jgi:hypothetical protein
MESHIQDGEIKVELYPKLSDDGPLYYVEFTDWKDGKAETWRLFKRQWIMPKKDFMDEIGKHPLMSREGHPWQLESGNVNPREESVDLNTKGFLKFLVDCLNLSTEEHCK